MTGPAPGQRIGPYEILDRLGRGGMGVVYRARDTRLGRTVALKFLPPQLAVDPDANARFMREAKAASALDHANICTIHEIGETDDGALYIVMAHYDGAPLDALIRQGPLPVERVTAIATQLASALERAHEAGIVHRDLKPANVMITDRGEVKLLDFGIAKLATATGITETGTTLGTVSYMSPEQVHAETLDHRTDLWSLGVVLYEMLTGRLPFEGETAPVVMFGIVDKVPAPLLSLRADTPASLAALVDACLQKQPEKRPQDARAVLAALGGGETVRVPARAVPRVWRRGGRRLALAGAVVAVTLVAAGVGWMGWGGEPDAGELVDGLVAVVPFTVRGSPDLGYLGEGIVDLMSAKLDGAGGTTVVNPRLTIAAVARDDVDVADLRATGLLARRLRAERYVTGDVVEVGGRVQLTAFLYDTRKPEAALQRATVEGRAEDLFDLIDGLAADLLAGAVQDGGGRLPSLAAATTPSLPAAKAFLEGERLFRAGQYRESAAAYDRAVALDSTFALAHYRKSIAAEWIDAYDARTSADRAMRYADRLAPRDRSVLAALRLRRHGDNTGAEQAYRAHLHQYADDVEALVQLGEVLFHDNPRRGRPLSEALIPFQRAVALEPGNLLAQVHLARIQAIADSTDALRRTAAFLAEVAPESERYIEMEALAAYGARDTVLQRRVREQLAGKPWYYRWYASHGVARFARDPHGALEVLSPGADDDVLLRMLVPNLQIVRGRYRDFRQFMAGVRGRGNPSWDVYEAFVVTSGAYPASQAELAAVLARLNRATPAALMSTAWLPPYEDLTSRFIAFELAYYRALLLIQLGRAGEARPIIRSLAGAEAFTGLGTMQPDAVNGLEAEILYRDGKLREALDRVRRVVYEVPHAATVRPLPDGSRARFLRAELELAVGDPAVARNYFVGLDDSWSFWDTYYRPQAYQRLAEIAEAEGRTADAITWYSRLLDDWRDCDPELVPQRDDVAARRDALRAR